MYIAKHLSCYSSVSLTLVLIRRDSGLSTLCHSTGFDYQQRVLKTLKSLKELTAQGAKSLSSNIKVIYIYIYIYIYVLDPKVYEVINWLNKNLKTNFV